MLSIVPHQRPWMTLKGYYALRLRSRHSLHLFIVTGYYPLTSCLFIIRCFEEFGKINVLKYTSWLYSQQLLAVRFVLEQ